MADRLLNCSIYTRHHCSVLQRHHVVPKSWFEHAGQKVDTPLVDLCPNCHTDVHSAIDRMLAGRPVAFLPRRCRRLATAALALAQEKGLTPAPTL